MQPKSIDRIFWDAAQIASAAERDAFVDRMCADDAELRMRVQQLLDARSKAEDFLECRSPSLVATVDELVLAWVENTGDSTRVRTARTSLPR